MNTVVQIATGHASESGHWYTQLGVPAYEVPNKSKGGFRPATLRDAKQLGLVPSVSTIIGQLEKPALTQWKLEWLGMAAATEPKQPGDTPEAWLERVKAEYRRRSEESMALGTTIHKWLEEGLSGRPVPAEFEPYVTAVEGFLMERFPGANRGECEVSFAHWWGFGGKVDWVLRALPYGIKFDYQGVVVDFKTSDFDESADPAKMAYPERHLQLAAYAFGLKIWEPRLLNVFVSTRRPGLVCAHEYPIGEYPRMRQWFYHLLKAWQVYKKHDCGWDPDEFAYDEGNA